MRVAVVVLLVLAAALAYAYRSSMIRGAPILPVAFEHLDHTEEACTLCHHNFVDDTGFDSCYSCHKHDPNVALQVESMFHDFCRACHIDRALMGEASGPFRVCDQCHNDSGRLPQNVAQAGP